jgi:hypothetical protein
LSEPFFGKCSSTQRIPTYPVSTTRPGRRYSVSGEGAAAAGAGASRSVRSTSRVS